MEITEAVHIQTDSASSAKPKSLGIVMSGGGSRAAYQIGALKAVNETLANSQLKPNIVAGTSVGAINSIVFGNCLNLGATQAIELIESIWNNRSYRNTFGGSIPRSFMKAIQIAILRYSSPGPQASEISIFDPKPLQDEIDLLIKDTAGNYPEYLDAIAVMTTLEGSQRKPLLLAQLNNKTKKHNMKGATFELVEIERLKASHGLASAALPSVLPAVDLDIEQKKVRLVDGGICDNVPVDPAVRLGADEVILIDSSGRRWWFDRYDEPHDTKPKWEVPAQDESFCLCPDRFIECRNLEGLGMLLKQATGSSTRSFIQALGPTWPIFKILKHKMGEELAYEVMSYVALDPQYTKALLERGYNETKKVLKGVAPLNQLKKFEAIK